jgi:hypothetical protein
MVNELGFCTLATTSQAYGDAYIKQQDRLIESLTDLYTDPDYNKYFIYTDKYPPGARPFLDSLYGFKPHLIEEARKAGLYKVAYFDTAMILQKPLPYYGVPVVAVRDTCKTPASDKCLRYFGMKREELDRVPFVGGSFFLFDFEFPEAKAVLADWRTAEQMGIFGSQRQESFEGLQGHRHDETVLAIILYKYGIDPLTPDKVGYNLGEDSIMIKKHFK